MITQDAPHLATARAYTEDAARALLAQANETQERAHDAALAGRWKRSAMLTMEAARSLTAAGRFYEAAAEWLTMPEMETDSNYEHARELRHRANRAHDTAERMKRTARHHAEIGKE